MNYPLRNTLQQFYVKTILRVLHKSNEDILKNDQTKYISPKFFYAHKFQKNGEINVQQIILSDNLANLFTKALLTATTFKMFVHQIEIHQLISLNIKPLHTIYSCYHEGERHYRMLAYYTFSFFVQILSHWVLPTKFLTRQF